MDFERVSKRQSVREGFVVLLRAEAELLLPPNEWSTMRAFYERIAEACMNWVIEIYGEELRRHFLSLQDIREKSRFRTQSYRFFMRSPWEDSEHITILCESERSSPNGEHDFYRICHTWNCKEQSILPPMQCKRLFDMMENARKFPFQPDGFYQEDGHIVIYKNQSSTNRFMQLVLPKTKL